uniref:Uncharacterized protein n=1 Tax=Haptolina brevifila TaxID=156173 RepID=A0A7S2HRP3_9EUKA|mmetsp:Transcript_57088/g.113398  ORF Transcript_57088/g.113398 Transcript_57088/m.113398 type:complete len:183 (+) Transcript_57088:284-832(+)
MFGARTIPAKLVPLAARPSRGSMARMGWRNRTDAWTYAWTVFVGFIPAGIPYAYVAVLGKAAATSFPPKDPVLIVVAALGLGATLLVVWKLGSFARSRLAAAGIELGGGSGGGAMKEGATAGSCEHCATLCARVPCFQSKDAESVAAPAQGGRIPLYVPPVPPSPSNPVPVDKVLARNSWLV